MARLGIGFGVVLLLVAARAGRSTDSDEQAAPATPAPSSSAPAETPPAPPAQPPAPPAQPRASDAESATTGQWVFTQQYGWIWMPYGDFYASVPSNGEGDPYEYVYCPSYGWTWVVAPWVWGWGPWPFFGAIGPRHFGWYSHGWWRSPWRWHLRSEPFRGGIASHGVRPAPRGIGFVGRGGAHLAGGGHVGGGGHGGHR